tara:strand:+ start:106 stop:498 length:393 start_codon:yes stop_codon:yes gene_type:complete
MAYLLLSAEFKKLLTEYIEITAIKIKQLLFKKNDNFLFKITLVRKLKKRNNKAPKITDLLPYINPMSKTEITINNAVAIIYLFEYFDNNIRIPAVGKLDIAIRSVKLLIGNFRIKKKFRNKKIKEKNKRE